MKVSWLLDRFALAQQHDELFQTIVDLGHIVKSVDPPQPPWTWDDVDSSFFNCFPAGSCVVATGDIDMVLRILDNPIWTPGVFAKIKHYFCSNYFVHLGEYLLNRDYIMLPFGELKRCRKFLFDSLGNREKLFIRPDSPLKTFTGQIVSNVEFEKDLDYLEFHNPQDNDLVVVSTPKKLLFEWRLIIVNQKVVAGSLYKDFIGQRTQRLDDTSHAWQFGQRVCDETSFAPERVWVLDVCQTEDKAFHVVEVGGFSFAGLYDCDKRSIVSAVSGAAAQIHKDKRGKDPR